MAVFLARMVMPRSRSSSLESITRSTWVSLARKVPLWFSMASTSVVFPWSTWAMMAILRRLLLKTTVLPVGGKPRATRQTEGFGTGTTSLQYAAGKSFATETHHGTSRNQVRLPSDLDGRLEEGLSC